MKKPTLNDIQIRTDLRPGDIGYVIHLHGALYKKEYDYGIQFETYVAEGLLEFWKQYDPARNRVWVCEHNGAMVGFMLLFNRGEAAQLRYFLIHPDYRGIGLGKKLMQLFMSFMESSGFTRSYLWTTDELPTAASLYTRSGFQLVEEKKSEAFGKKVCEQKYEFIAGRTKK
jgi:N-acetylglutamate synthase-like GNAT family acetyltransferase